MPVTMRFVPMVGLFAMLALVPAALGHHCNSGDESSSDLTAQSTAPSSTTFSAILVGAMLLVPFAVVGTVVAVARGTSGTRTPPGSWVWTPTAWVWVPKQK